MSIINEDNIWFSPIRAFSDYAKIQKEVDQKTIQQASQYMKVMETRAVAILCFALFEANKTPWYLQICQQDPPDALIMRQSPNSIGDDEILGVEVTSYVRNKTGMPQETLLEQLKKTKMFAHYHKYSDHDVILVDLGTRFQPNVNEIADYMKEIGAPYQVWIIQQVEAFPDTLAEMTICNTQGAYSARINIGEAWHNMVEQKVLGAFRKIRVGSVDKVRVEKGEPITRRPWEPPV